MLKKIILMLFAIIPFVFIGYIVVNASITQETQKDYVPQIERVITLDEDKLFNLVQKWRVNNGYNAYAKNNILCEFASKRLEQIRSDWSHNQFFVVLRQYSSVGFDMFGENLAKDEKNESATLNDWLKSPSHRKNLEDNFTDSCIRCEREDCVQIFAR